MEAAAEAALGFGFVSIRLKDGRLYLGSINAALKLRVAAFFKLDGVGLDILTILNRVGLSLKVIRNTSYIYYKL